ncbi:MAG TPA: pseudouridine synthase [Deltaproteobacteria bacterium]|nr:pseudouridine synthase [Deltaproteobacteria bacterium]
MLIALNKPFGVLTQFTDSSGRPTLADFVPVPDVYPCGRLDRDSEGLVLLTDDGALQHRLSHPKHGKWKGYWVLVERVPDAQALAAIRGGVMVRGRKTQPARVQWMEPPAVWDRDPPVRTRQTVVDQWLELWIGEGMNRQVRRMTAAVGHPTLRLIRFAIGDYRLDQLQPGEWREEAVRPSEPRTRRASKRRRR